MKPNPSSQQVNDRILQLEEEIRQLQVELAVLRSQKLVEYLIESDMPMPRENRTVVRTEAGLTVKGSRLTLYYILDGIKAGTSLKDIRDMYELTDEETLDILDYIHLNKEAVESEYQQVLKTADENQKYWEERNRELAAKNYQQKEIVRAKLREWREQYHAGNKS